MFINATKLLELPSPFMLPLLLVLKQAGRKDMSEAVSMLITSDEDLEELEQKGYIKYIKGKPNENEFQKLRLDKVGNEFLNSLGDPDVLQEDIEFSEWLIKLYKSKGKTIKSGKKLQRLIAWFRETTEISRNKLGFLLLEFVKEQEKSDFTYSHDVNNIFWKPTNMFQTKPSLDDSRLYSFYLSDKEKFDEKFKNL